MKLDLDRTITTLVRVAVEAPDPLSHAGLRAALEQGEEICVVDHPMLAETTVLALRTIDTVGLARVTALRTLHDVRVVLVIDDLDEAGLLSAAEHGVVGVLLRRETDADALRDAVTNAANGGASMSPVLVARLLDAVERLSRQSLQPNGMTLLGLSDREIDVLRLLAEGYDTAEVAAQLNYSVRTIKSVVAQVVNRFDLRNRTQAVVYAVRMGLI